MQSTKARIARRIRQAKALFNASVKNKRTDHWKLCLASYYVVGLRDGSTEKLAQDNDGVSVDSIEDYARTYRLYSAIRKRFYRLRCVGIARFPEMKKVYEKAYAQTARDLRDLRKELHYTKWLVVANGVYTGFKTEDGRKKLTLPQALDALKSGADGVGVEMFAALVAGAEISRSKAYRKALKALIGVLSYPQPKRKRMALRKALMIVEKELGVNNGQIKK